MTEVVVNLTNNKIKTIVFAKEGYPECLTKKLKNHEKKKFSFNGWFVYSCINFSALYG